MNFATIFFPNLSQILCYGLESILPHGAEAEKCHISSSSSTRSHAMDKFDRFSLFQTNMHTRAPWAMLQQGQVAFFKTV